MTTAIYRIARHVVAITCEHEADHQLLPSFQPFALETQPEGEPLLTHVSVHDQWEFAPREDKVGRFDCGDTVFIVYQLPGGWLIDVEDAKEKLCGTMQSTADFAECHVQLYGTTPRQRTFALNNCMMLSYAFAGADKQTVLIHSSVIRKDGKGYMMTAPSGTGKSTHTHLWYTTLPGCDLMNDDNPVIRIVDGEARVFGTPWSGKTPCYRNIEAPIGAIVRLFQRPQNEIRRLSVLESFAVLLPAISVMKWDPRVYNGVCDTISRLIERVGIYELGCLPNAEAAILCHATVSQPIAPTTAER